MISNKKKIIKHYYTHVCESELRIEYRKSASASEFIEIKCAFFEMQSNSAASQFFFVADL